MLNYPVDRALLEPCVPIGTALDTYRGQAFVSVVAFEFLRTRVLGVPIPLHQDFLELNLRFYVRRFSGEEWRRGVVFAKEVVPKPAIALLARWIYNEKYVALPMRATFSPDASGAPGTVRYEWEQAGVWNRVEGTSAGPAAEPVPGSLEEFITEHYWGYTAQRDGGTLEYRVDHPRWRVWAATSAGIHGDTAPLYGGPLAAALSQAPASAFIAEGSPVTVYQGVRI